MSIAEALGISEVAEAAGVSAHTLRYYERAGLMLDPIGRSPSRHRRYTDPEIRWVLFLTKLRRTGMPIRLIRAYADLVRAGEGNETERLSLLETHRRTVLRRLGETRVNLQAIEHKIALYRAAGEHYASVADREVGR
jgi:DNA-binding transcriptional MerR regulator